MRNYILILVRCFLVARKIRFSCGVKTATFDGRLIRINPRWFLGLRSAQKIAVIRHETLHYLVWQNVRSAKAGWE